MPSSGKFRQNKIKLKIFLETGSISSLQWNDSGYSLHLSKLNDSSVLFKKTNILSVFPIGCLWFLSKKNLKNCKNCPIGLLVLQGRLTLWQQTGGRTVAVMGRQEDMRWQLEEARWVGCRMMQLTWSSWQLRILIDTSSPAKESWSFY